MAGPFRVEPPHVRFVWFFYMLSVDKLRAELMAQIDSAPMPG